MLVSPLSPVLPLGPPDPSVPGDPGCPCPGAPTSPLVPGGTSDKWRWKYNIKGLLHVKAFVMGLCDTPQAYKP